MTKRSDHGLICSLLTATMLVTTTRSWAAERELKEFLRTPATAALVAYQKFLSPIKGKSCPMTPSDSAYARQAIKRDGVIIGTLEAVDRLHRCGHDLGNYPLVETADGLKYNDPLQ